MPSGPYKEVPVLVRRYRERGKLQETLLWFLWEGTGEAGPVGLGMASLNNLGTLSGIEAVPSGLVPGPGWLGQVDNGMER